MKKWFLQILESFKMNSSDYPVFLKCSTFSNNILEYAVSLFLYSLWINLAICPLTGEGTVYNFRYCICVDLLHIPLPQKACKKESDKLFS
jgi:hypothetical protein